MAGSTWLAFLPAATLFSIFLVLAILSYAGPTSRFARFAKLRWLPPIRIACLVGAYLLLRPGAGVDGAAVLSAGAQAGRPVFVELYSNY